MVIEFDSLEYALEEAQWCADVYKTRHAIVHINERYGVCGADELTKPQDLRDVLEIVTPTNEGHCRLKDLL